MKPQGQPTQDEIMMRAAVLKLMDLGQKPDCDELVKRGEVSTLKAAECRWAKIRKECLQADEVAQAKADGEANESSTNKTASESATKKTASKKPATSKQPAKKKRKVIEESNEDEDA